MQRRDYKGARIDYNTLLQEEPGNNTARLAGHFKSEGVEVS